MFLLIARHTWNSHCVPNQFATDWVVLFIVRKNLFLFNNNKDGFHLQSLAHYWQSQKNRCQWHMHHDDKAGVVICGQVVLSNVPNLLWTYPVGGPLVHLLTFTAQTFVTALIRCHIECHVMSVPRHCVCYTTYTSYRPLLTFDSNENVKIEKIKLSADSW